MTTATKLGHLDRTLTEPREEELLTVKIASIENANENIRLLKLELPGPAKFTAGQWLDTFVPGEPKPGGFTIASAPSAAMQTSKPYMELAVQKAPENPAAAWLWRPQSEILGKDLHIRLGGSFICPPAEGLEGIRRIVLVAGGVGINPLMSMIGYIANSKQESDIQVSILYGTKVPEDGNLGNVLFLDRITNHFEQKRVTGKLRLFLTGSAPHPGDQLRYKTREVDIALGKMTAGNLLQEIHTGGGKDSTLVYICGPPPMTDNFVNMLTTPELAGIINSAHVKSEKWW